MISFADLSVADHRRSAQGRVHFINAPDTAKRGASPSCVKDIALRVLAPSQIFLRKTGDAFWVPFPKNCKQFHHP